MNRRGLGRGRLVAGIGSVIVLIGCFLPWSRVGGDGLPSLSTNGFVGPGILVWLAALAVLAIIALPYAAGDQPLAIDRPASFVAVVGVGVAALVLRLLQLWSDGELGFPDRAPGLWIAIVGLAVAAIGAASIVGERSGR
ncbi:MAG: hypothetical protein ACHQ15_05355 [Candidatus Limnocylindrales bacterium]